MAPQLPFVPTPKPTPEQPREVAVSVVTARNGEPVAGGRADRGRATAYDRRHGQGHPDAPCAAQPSRSAPPGHDPAEATVPDEGDLRVELRAERRHRDRHRRGRGAAVRRARLRRRRRGHGRDRRGRRLSPRRACRRRARSCYKMPGYRLARADRRRRDGSRRRAGAVRGARPVRARGDLRGTRAGSTRCSPSRSHRGERAWSSTSRRPTGASTTPPTCRAAAEVGAIRETPVFDLEELLPMLKERGIYTIARMVS